MASQPPSVKIAAYTGALKARLEARAQAFATDLLGSLIQDTPWRSGQARANWRVTVGAGLSSTFIRLPGAREAHPAYDAGAVNAARAAGLSAIGGYKSPQRITLYNTAPYIQRLNEGYSAQAPAGFIEAAVAKARAQHGRR